MADLLSHPELGGQVNEGGGDSTSLPAATQTVQVNVINTDAVSPREIRHMAANADKEQTDTYPVAPPLRGVFKGIKSIQQKDPGPYVRSSRLESCQRRNASSTT